MDPNKLLYMIDPDNCDYITSIKYIGFLEDIISSRLLIFKISILYKQCQHNDLNGNIVISITETSYINDNVALEQLQHFVDYIKNKRQDTWLLLIIDGYESYMTISFHNLATKNKIVLFYFLPYFTYLIQPLNVRVFQLFKHYHIDAIDKVVRLGDKKFGKLKFLAVFQLFCNQTFKPITICHAFKLTGLVLFDFNVILDKIRKKQA